MKTKKIKTKPDRFKIRSIDERDRMTIWNMMQSEGFDFDYCFRYYSDFRKMNDPHLNTLIKNYREAAALLEKYIRPAEAK